MARRNATITGWRGRSRPMKTVQDIYFEVLAMNKRRLPVEQIGRKIVEAWHVEHPGVIIERGSTKTVQFDFPNGELISFDGTHWHHDRRR
jgi:hypothetical protein